MGKRKYDSQNFQDQDDEEYLTDATDEPPECKKQRTGSSDSSTPIQSSDDEDNEPKSLTYYPRQDSKEEEEEEEEEVEEEEDDNNNTLYSSISTADQVSQILNDNELAIRLNKQIAIIEVAVQEKEEQLASIRREIRSADDATYETSSGNISRRALHYDLVVKKDQLQDAIKKQQLRLADNTKQQEEVKKEQVWIFVLVLMALIVIVVVLSTIYYSYLKVKSWFV